MAAEALAAAGALDRVDRVTVVEGFSAALERVEVRVGALILLSILEVKDN